MQRATIRPWLGLTLGVALALALAPGCSDPSAPEREPDSEATVAFGSCLHQWRPQPVWQGVNALAPDAFVFLGDTVYADVAEYASQPDPERIQAAYRDLAERPEFQRFRAQASRDGTRIFGVWDDHDYGVNDGGADYPHRLQSKRYFMEFFDLEQTATGPDAPGIYRSELVEWGGLRWQLLLLDLRSFRSPLLMDAPDADCPRKKAGQNTDPEATMLGPSQWTWLEQELSKPADVRILASSIQLLPNESCFEKWSNFPHERKRLFELLRRTRAEGVVVISGDRHLAEISVLPADVIGYPLYEITASGLNAAIGPGGEKGAERNRLRVSPESVRENNFGSIQLRGDSLLLQIRDEAGAVVQERGVGLAELTLSEEAR